MDFTRLGFVPDCKQADIVVVVARKVLGTDFGNGDTTGFHEVGGSGDCDFTTSAHPLPAVEPGSEATHASI